jgi:hypothetical protein
MRLAHELRELPISDAAVLGEHLENQPQPRTPRLHLCVRLACHRDAGKTRADYLGTAAGCARIAARCCTVGPVVVENEDLRTCALVLRTHVFTGHLGDHIPSGTVG